ncbi:hypothetical protein G7046_g4719 [Stylonectria norvegica]|nr:hypothetical protein G7046_g4719 [Stylonectria norvegica]
MPTQRVTYRRRNPYNTTSNRTRVVRTPGGDLRLLHIKKRGTVPKCGDCGSKLSGIPALRPREYSQISKPKKTVQRAYGGSRCGGCVRDRIVRAFLIEEQKIVKKVLKEQEQGPEKNVNPRDIFNIHGFATLHACTNTTTTSHSPSSTTGRLFDHPPKLIMSARSFIRHCNAPRALRQALHSDSLSASRRVLAAINPTPSPCTHAVPSARRAFHDVRSRRKRQEVPAHNGPTDFNELDVLGNTPAPSTSVDVCMYDGFGLNSGVTVTDGNGVLLVDGEVFKWRPWEVKGTFTLLNQKGQVELPTEAFALFDLIWPRPDLLIIGVGPHLAPLSPDTKRRISDLGMRVDVLDTRNAASQFNLLATERGVSDVAAALIPIGWKEGVGCE